MNDLLKDFQLYLLVEKGYSTNTIESYLRDLTYLLKFLETVDESLDSFTRESVRLYEHQLAKSYEPSTVLRFQAALNSFITFAKEEDYFEEDFNINFPKMKKSKKLPKFLTEEEVADLIMAPDISSILGLRDRVILEIMYATGIRVSEVIHLEIQNVLFDISCLRIIGKGDKERIVPFGESAKKFLLRYLEIERKLLMKDKVSNIVFLNRFGNKMTRQSIWKLIKKYAKEKQIRESVSPHILRHTFATHLLNHGADLRFIQEMLGHSNISTTEIYTHLTHENLLSVYQKLHPRS